ncbi:hypothetical protein [Streptomyces sp. NBC_00878]|uniref:hypothetical protein n=1 Tax=Streptomyces sp. NBC_00878 TaxID=2975854 RepID=UPI0022562887|nr:hypothetical protein [Streptomyces sp. NBC_00878]MCX4904454.1 hypothetical protein [Streptomyces sp. NBC_00878]
MFRRRERRYEEPGPYWKQRSWQLSAGFLGLVFVLGGIVALTSGGDTEADRAAAAAASDGPLTGTSVAKDGRPQGCRTDDSAGDAVPTAAPGDISWRTLGVARVPVSTSAGPTRMESALWWCFAHTPTGAVLAANIIPSQMSGSHWRTVTEQQVVAGQGREMWEFQRATVQDVDDAAADGTPVASYVGYSVTSYKSTAATVRLLLKGDQGYATTTIVLRWSGGDWKVLPDDSGALHSPVSTAQSTNGFTLWGV